MQGVCNRVAAQGEREGEKNFYLIGVYQPHEKRSDPGGGDSEGKRSANPGHGEKHDVSDGGGRTSGRVEQGEKDDGGDAIVEKRLAGELRLHMLRNTDPAQHLEDRDGIGGRD